MSILPTQAWTQEVKEIYFDDPNYSFWFSQKQQAIIDQLNAINGERLRRNYCFSGQYTEAIQGDQPSGLWDDYRLVQPRKVMKASAK